MLVYFPSFKMVKKALLVTSSIFVIANVVHLVHGPLPRESSEEKFGSTSNSENFSPDLSVNSLCAFISKWNTLNSAIDKFIEQYELQHQVKISVERHKMEEIGGDGDSVGRALLLRFSFKENDEDTHSSVLIQGDFFKSNSGATELMLYDKEEYMYNEVLSKMYDSWTLGKLSPNSYVHMPKSHIMILENLYQSTFYNNSMRQLNFQECKAVIKCLAQFHALSTLRIDHVYPGLDSLTVTDRAFMPNGDAETDLIFQKFRQFAFVFFSDEMRKELEKIAVNYRFLVNLAYLPNVGKFNVIVHGNLTWATIFLQKDNAKCKFNDFRNSRRGSPAIDLITFLITSAEFKMYAQNGKALCELYIDELGKTLEEIGASDRNSYSMEELSADIRKYKNYFISQIIRNPPIHWVNYLTNRTTPEFQERVFGSKPFAAMIKVWMRLLDAI